MKTKEVEVIEFHKIRDLQFVSTQSRDRALALVAVNQWSLMRRELVVAQVGVSQWSLMRRELLVAHLA